MKKAIIGVLGIIVFIVAVVAVFLGLGMFKKYTPTKDMADYDGYYGVSSEGQLGLVMNDELLGPRAVLVDGTPFIEYETVTSCLNSRFYYNASENVLLYTLPLETWQGTEGVDYVLVDGAPYLSVPVVAQNTDMEYTLYTEPNRLVIRNDWSDAAVATMKKSADLRIKGGPKSPVLAVLDKGDTVRVLGDEDEWTKVATDDGFIGYVKDKQIGETETQTFEHTPFAGPEYTHIKKEGKICMGWHHVMGMAANSYLYSAYAPTQGMNVIAPTWFFIEDTQGNVYSIADSDYVQEAHSLGLDVWAVVNDFDGEQNCNGINSAEETLALMSSSESRRNLISQIVSESLSAGVEGINVDIEKVSQECGPHYVQFIRELAVECRKEGLILSIDTYAPSAWSGFFNREEQAAVADYVVIMAYDEHGTWSEEAGSNSSVNYVAKAISDMLAVAPADQIIIALPFYTKLFEETPVPGTNEFDFSCISMTMVESEDLVANRGATLVYDEATGQNLASYESSNGTIVRMWMEDETSLGAKLTLMQENDLAGAAFWKLTQERPSIWNTISTYF